jgi:hypothetical protein
LTRFRLNLRDVCRHQGYACVRCEWSNDDHWWCSWPSLNERVCVWCAWSGISQLKSERIKSTRYYPQEDGYKSQERKWRDPGHDCWTMVSDVCCSARTHTQMSSCITTIKSPTLGAVSLILYQKEKVTCVNFSRGHHCHLRALRCNQCTYHEPEASTTILIGLFVLFW